MDAGWLMALSGFALAMAGTPGPNNTIVTAAGATYGFRRTLPLLAGITIGVALIMLAVAMLGGPIARDPRIQQGLKWAGLIYLLWLAWKIASARPTIPNADDGNRGVSMPLTLMHGVLFQLVNPKLWAMAAGAVVTYGSTTEGAAPVSVAIVFAILFGIATFASIALWTLIGVGAARFIRTARAMRVFNWTMAALLIGSLVPVMVSG